MKPGNNIGENIKHVASSFKATMRPGKNIGANLKHIATNINYDGIQFRGVTRGFGKWALANYINYFVRSKIVNGMRVSVRMYPLSLLRLQPTCQTSPQTQTKIKRQIESQWK